MSLHIKNERTHALVRELAERTGQSQTSAVESAVQRMLDQLNTEDEAVRAGRHEEIQEVLARLHALPDAGPSFREIMDEMYDDDGVPR